MSTLHQGTPMSASIWHLAWTAIVLLPLTASAATEDAIAGPHPADDSRVAQPEVWLCAGDRIMELLQPGAEWPFVQQHLTGIKLYIGQLHGKRRETKEQTSVDWLTRVRRYEDFAREQNLTFNLIVNSERGGQESDERFFRETLLMVDTYRRAGGRPTRWFVQSWYPHPKQMLPETAPPSLTALVKAVIERVRGETLSREMPEESAALGGGVTSPHEQAFLRRHLQPDDETQTPAHYEALTLAGAKTATPLSPPSPPVTVATEPKRVPCSPATQAERDKWDRADQFRSQTGPAGTEWDAPYRALIQTSENAVSKGLPSHAEAARLIQDDAGQSAESLATHLGWVLYIKHFSQAYRPEEATANLQRLYADLVAMQSGNDSRPATRPFDGDARLTIHRDVVYGSTHPEIQKLDAYLVKAAQPTPVVIEIHGGGWRRGSKSEFTYPSDLIGDILAAGISVVSIDYRLTPQHTMPAQIEDTVRAVQFVRAHASEWNLDPDRMAALGGSAGAHLAAWVALHDDFAKADSADPVERCSSRLTCFVPLSGPMDLTRVRPTELASQPLRGQDFANAYTAAFGCTAEQFEQEPAVRQRIRDASPLFLVTPDDPPALVLGAWRDDMAVLRDPPVPAVINDPHSAWHGALLAEALRKAGVQVEVRIGPDVGKDRKADAAVVVTFLRQWLLPQ